MSTFVYNDGSFESEKKGVLSVTFGLFFDGTKNNRYHTEIRKKIENKGEFEGQTPTQEERDIYASYGENESFGNDFTNVARKFMCCEEVYAIYVEGIGTVGKDVEEKDDEMDGYAYGRGVTGIISKVEAGCMMLAKKIASHSSEKEKNGDEKISQINLTVDAFGFSRGAAAARHFLYNLQMKPYAPSSRVINVVHNIPSSLAVIKEDYAGNFVKESWIKNEQLPRGGFLGTKLLDAGISRELIETMKITVRFLGIYDTVASYDPDCLIFPNFEKQIHKLHLHELGTPWRAVHYTALNEHRKNFSLTRLKIGEEFEFPGVHSDVGGSYNHDKLSMQEFARKQEKAKLMFQSIPTPKASEYEMVRLDEDTFLKSLKKFREEMIQEGWFKDDQIEVQYSFLPMRRYLYAERILNRGYSFIPLHFMNDEAFVYLKENLLTSKLFADYALEDDFLEKVKAYLKKHTIEGKSKWELKDPSVSQNNNENHSILDSHNEIEPEENSHTASEEIIPTFELEGVEVSAYQSDYMLRRLRNEYLHWSAKINSTSDKIAHRPAKGRKRNEF